MKLIVGLGNPGARYEKTRHNTGFMFIDTYLEKYHPVWKNKFNGKYYELIKDNEKVIFIKPMSCMNLSGEVVGKFANFYKVDPSDILIVSDDLAQELGRFRLRSRGSSGGHNGLKNIEEHLNSDNYKRLRIGIKGNTYDKNNTIDYVLGDFSKEEKEILQNLFPLLSIVLDDYFNLDFNSLMGKYNRRK